MVLRSKEYDDVYFSKEDGLAETQHVFLQGNNLPQAWEGSSQEKKGSVCSQRFVVAETGFGTGLNFLATWDLFKKALQSNKQMQYSQLEFISFEKHPLKPEEISSALEPWKDKFSDKLELLLSNYPARIPGFHRMELSKNIALILVFDDINDSLPRLQANVDCWFLDGFKPSSNPDMWSETVFKNIARTSSKGASFATFTAAGFVKRALEECGFNVQKSKGFGRKREMLIGKKVSSQKIIKSNQEEAKE